MLALQINKIKLTDPLVDIAFSRKMVQTLSEITNNCGKKRRRLSLSLEIPAKIDKKINMKKKKMMLESYQKHLKKLIRKRNKWFS
uniref:Uncharacterized protein n=1 Tax=Rhizophora mucronata TaxID=61149 RepID=A0A2P2JP59_RHIMU